MHDVNKLLICFHLFLAITATSIVDTANIFHHVSIVKENSQLFLQLVIIDKAEYNEQSTKLLQFLQKNKLKEVFESKLIKLLVKLSCKTKIENL